MNEQREERKGDQECMTTTVINKQTHQTVETPQRGTTTTNATLSACTRTDFLAVFPFLKNSLTS
jgi:hypothetical protein